MSFEGWGSQWNRIKTLAQDTDWKKMAENAVKRVGTGIDRAIGVPDEVSDGTARATKRKDLTRRKLSVKKRTNSTSDLHPAKSSTNSPKELTSSSNSTPAPTSLPNDGTPIIPSTTTPIPENQPSESTTVDQKTPVDHNAQANGEGTLIDIPLSEDIKNEDGGGEANLVQKSPKSPQVPRAASDGLQEVSLDDEEENEGAVENGGKENSHYLQSGEQSPSHPKNPDIKSNPSPTEPKTDNQTEPRHTPEPKTVNQSEPRHITELKTDNQSEPRHTPEPKTDNQSEPRHAPEPQPEPSPGPTPEIDPVTLEILTQAKEEYDRLEKRTNQIEDQNKMLRQALAQAKKLETTLKQREHQVEKLVRENARVSEQNDNLKSDRERADQRNRSLTGKIALLEARLGEISTLKAKVRDAETALDRTRKILENKENDVKQVIKEGQMMSKKQHGKDVLIRNLRKETEDKNLEIQKLKRELESKANDMRSANTKAAAANNEAEETTSKLKFLAKKNSALSERLLEAEGEARKFQQIATKQQEALKSTAQKIRVRDSKIEKAIASLRERKKEKEELQKEVTELQDAHEKLTSLYETARVSLKQVEKKLRDQEEASAEHERTLQKQMQDLRRKMHERELLWQEASEAIPQATRPLLERIAVLSQTLEYNKETQVEVERNHAKEVSRISHTLKEVNRELNQKIDQIAESKEIFDRRGEMVEKLHTKYTELTKQYDASQAKVKKVEEDIMRITQQANDLKSNRQELINARENAEEKLQQLLVTTRLEHNKLRQALASERSRRKDLAYRIKALQQTVNQGNPKTKTPGTPIMFSKQQTEEEVMRSSLTGKEIKSTNEFIGSPNKQAEGLDQVTWQMIDKMRSEVRQKEGSIFSLRQKIKILEDHRKTLSEKMVELTRANAENETRLQNADKLEAAHREVSSRYEIAMDVIGEKEEELVHLRGDMEHIKEKFREQIELLIDRIETLEGKSKKPAGLGSPDTGKTSEKSAASRSEKKD